MSNPIMIFGSSNSFGKTRTILDELRGDDIPLVDLKALDITPFDYEHKNQHDDYLPLMENIIHHHDLIVLATPVYWYTMSATMKIFLDRISDLWEFKKDLLPKLKGKGLFVITTFGTSLPKGFEYPFEQTCEYLGMNYLGCSFISTSTDPELMKHNDTELEKAKKVLGGIKKG